MSHRFFARLRAKPRSYLPAAVLNAATALLVLLPHASPGFAQSTPAPLVNPGLWEITPQSNAGASVSYRLCFARGDLDNLKLLLPNLGNSADCPLQETKAVDGVMTWALNCPAKLFRGEGRYALTATTITANAQSFALANFSGVADANSISFRTGDGDDRITVEPALNVIV